MSAGGIRDALNAYFAGFSAHGLGDIVYEGQLYTPDPKTPYVITRLAAYTRSAMTAGPQPVHREAGTFQIDVMRPVSEGIGRAEFIADEIVAFFPRTAVIATATNQAVLVDVASAMPRMPDSAWIMIPIVVAWFANQPS